MNKNFSKYWLFIGFTALAISGIFAIFLVLGRSPYFTNLIPHIDFFRSALTIHVNLSVLIWLLSIFSAIGFLSIQKNFFLAKIPLFLAVSAIAILTFSIFDFNSKAYINNYVPFTESKFLQFAIYLFIFAIFINAILIIADFNFSHNAYISSFCGSIIFILSVFSLVKTYNILTSQEFKNLFFEADFYEKLFWPFGHILMFLYSAIAIYAWFTIAMLIASKLGYTANLRLKKGLEICQITNLFCAIIAVPICFLYKPSDFEFTDLYTKHMIYFGGFSSSLAIILTAKEFFKIFKFNDNHKFIFYNFFWSVLLFLSGGFIALLIEGSNTKIPAHYHGSIIGISLALMGLSFYFLEIYGYKIIANHFIKYQAHLYGLGQIIHITGLAISGGYGALRKTPAVMQSFEGKFYMGLMGFGGFLAIIGGFYFIVAVLKILRNERYG
ncbi:MAG: hypothetical protein SFT90_07030 [Rickettsiales bacterium]|nr:hypothetical protein [Rickettsiales bacterium]